MQLQQSIDGLNHQILLMNDQVKEKESKIAECTTLIAEKEEAIASLNQRIEEEKNRPPPSPKSAVLRDKQQIEELNSEIQELQQRNTEIADKLE